MRSKGIRYFQQYIPTALFSFLLGILFSALLLIDQTPSQCLQEATTSAVQETENNVMTKPATIPASLPLESQILKAPITEPEPTKQPYPPLVDKEDIVITPNPCPRNTFLLILVVTSSRNFAVRKSIRRSWGQESCKNNSSNAGSTKTFCVVFVLGSDGQNDRLIAREANRYHDVLRGAFEDVYRQNEEHSIKALFGFKWATSSCKAKYILKASSESFVNVPQLVFMLKKKTSEVDENPVNDLYMGYCHGIKTGGATVVRNPGSPWYISEDEWSDSKLPPYASGMGIVLSFDVVRRIVEMSLKEKLIHIDDVYIGVMATKLSVTCVDDSTRFDMSYTTMLTECEDLNFCVLGGVPSKDMFYLDQNTRNLKEIC